MAERQKMVTAVFRNREDAESAFDALLASGYADSEIDVMMSEKTRSSYYSRREEGERHEVGSKMGEGMAIGGAVGTAVGAALAAVAAIGTTLALPGLGLVIAGPIAAALAGAGAGGVAGGMVGGLIGLGISEDNAQAYHEALRSGGVFLGVRPHSDEDSRRIRKLFEDLRGENVLYG
jgi:hypothetical protein